MDLSVAEIALLATAFGVGTILSSLIQIFASRGTSKATAAQIVTDTTRVANEMVLAASSVFEEDNKILRAELKELRLAADETNRRLEKLQDRLDITLRELESLIPYLEHVGDDERANHIRELVEAIK